MRFLIAMIFAVAGALAVTMLAAVPIASWVVSQYSFESPDQVSNLHSLLYMGLNAAGLIVGWIIGWAIGGLFVGSGGKAT